MHAAIKVCIQAIYSSQCVSCLVGIMSLSCSGSEENITACRSVLTGQCGSAMYVSVTCQNTPFIDDGKLQIIFIYINF